MDNINYLKIIIIKIKIVYLNVYQLIKKTIQKNIEFKLLKRIQARLKMNYHYMMEQ